MTVSFVSFYLESISMLTHIHLVWSTSSSLHLRDKVREPARWVYGCGGNEQWYQGSNRNNRTLRFEPGASIVVDNDEVEVERHGKCSEA